MGDGAALTLAEAAKATGGRVVGDGGAVFRRVGTLRRAKPDEIALLADGRYRRHLADCRAAALLVSEPLSTVKGGPRDRLVVADPQAALAELLAVLHPEAPAEWGAHATASIHPDARVAERCAVGPNCVVGAGAKLRRGSRIGANSVVGEGAVVGRDSTLFPNVTLYPGAVIGDRVTVHAGSRIGVDGFGYATTGGVHVKVPQVGGCVIEDDVEIGANCTIDRGSIGRTRIGAGTKLDNLVHIAHNVVIGPGSLIVAQVGVAGSTRTGEGVLMGGQAGLVGHLRIGAGARIGAQAGVISDVAPGQAVSGYPARDHRAYLRAMARLMRLPDVVKRVNRMERLIERRLGQDGG